MEAPQAVDALAALAHAHRLAIHRVLVEAGPEGMSAGDIAQAVGITPSSLTFHVHVLRRAGLAGQRREGRQLIYSADFAAMNELVDYLTRNCCGGRRSCGPARASVADKPAPLADKPAPLAGKPVPVVDKRGPGAVKAAAGTRKRRSAA